MKLLLVLATIVSLGACATTAVPGDPPLREPVDSCKAEPGQRFIGQKATAETGAAIQRATGASELRWLAPGMIVTMEYKFGRVGVSYDGALTITRVSCG